MRLFESASRKSDPAIDEERFLRAARAYALKRFPNPERKGCPPAAEIGALAKHQISLSGIEDRARHIATCSPCLRDYLNARERWKRRRRRVIAVLAAAAGLGIVIAAASLLSPPAPGRSEGIKAYKWSKPNHDRRERGFRTGTHLRSKQRNVVPVLGGGQRAVEAEGEKKSRVTWFPVTAFSALAETCANYIDTGRLLAIQGRVQTREYEDRNGIRHHVMQVIANKVTFLGPSKRGDDSPRPTPGTPRSSNNSPQGGDPPF